MDVREDREVAQLAGPRMPADRGLSSLGLLMQLGGSLLAGYMALLALFPLFAGFGGDGALTVFLIGAAGVIRSGFHRAAGGALLYGAPGGAFRPVYTYARVSLIHTFATLLLLNQGGGLPTLVNLTVALLLLAWPVAVLIILSRPRLRELGRDDVLPMAEDLGFEASASLMLVFGLMGSLGALFMLYAAFRGPAGAPGPDSLVAVGVFAMLLARSVLHAMAGAKGTRGIDSDGATDAAARYFGFGVTSSVIVGGAALILAMSTPGIGLHPAMLILVAAAVYALLAWPLILRRFYTERNFSALLAGAEGPNHRRAPDAGMTAIGWLLLAVGIFHLCLALPSVLAGADLAVLGSLDDLSVLERFSLTHAGRSPWWSVGIGMTQVWAGLELVHMTDRHRLAATIYGVIGSLVALYLLWPQISRFESLGGIEASPTGAVASLFGLAFSLVLPVATAILANRDTMPSARARMRSTDG
jgi:hypothetical protein